MNWYKKLKANFSQEDYSKMVGGSYWILPNGKEVNVEYLHVTDGWEYLQLIEPNIDPEEEPSNTEDYKCFGKRGWVRIAMGNNITLFQNPPLPAVQASKTAKISTENRTPIRIDILDAQTNSPITTHRLPSNKTTVYNFLSKAIEPVKQEQIIPQITEPAPSVYNQELQNTL